MSENNNSEGGATSAQQLSATLPITSDSSRRLSRQKRLSDISCSESSASGKEAAPFPFKATNRLHEDHKQCIYGVAFSGVRTSQGNELFATTGDNRLTVYECRADGYIKCLRAYKDPDDLEEYYTCAWTVDEPKTSHLVAVAGKNGGIRVVNPHTNACECYLLSHTDVVNELRIHPQNHELLVSVSADHSVRLWNIRTEALVCLFASHTDQVLACDFSVDGRLLATCGGDKTVRLWNFQSEELQLAVKAAECYVNGENTKTFPSLLTELEVLETGEEIHTTLIDCVRWYGDLVFSKGHDDRIVMWKPESIAGVDSVNGVTVLRTFKVHGGTNWWMKFGVDPTYEYMAWGNMTGTLYLWELRQLVKPNYQPVVKRPKKPAARGRYGLIEGSGIVRQIAFSSDGHTFICVCDDHLVCRWDKTRVNASV